MDIYFIDLNLDKNITENKIQLNKLQHKFSRLFLKNILENVYGIKFEISEKNKKPYIENNPIYFSISHSKSLIGICFDTYNIGFDIEYKKDRDIKGLLKHYGLEDEKITKDEFYQMWTVYEAEYKAGQINQILSFNYNGYMCSVSCENEKINKIFELKIINPKIFSDEIYISKNDYSIQNLDINDFIMLSPLKTKLN